MMLAVLCLLTLLVPGQDEVQDPVSARVDLLVDHQTVAPGKPFWVAMRFKIEPGWHIYWDNPGDSGMPTTISLALPEEYDLGPPLWPAPVKFEDAGMVSYGFKGETVVLIEVTPTKEAAPGPLVIEASAKWMACNEICVIGEGAAKAVLTVGQAPSVAEANAKVFEGARKAIPPSGKDLKPSYSLADGFIDLKFQVPEGEKPNGAYFFVRQPGLVEAAAPQALSLREGSSECGLKIKIVEGQAERPKLLRGVLTIEYASNKILSFEIEAPMKG